ncbi:MAG: hypothetical protein KatS3mg114_0646 [Planctomycetaceae bacterium]|nr:MAG: hypothetical protein KatS3mg114_0646 [Planctomycetaceae bacterium]
MKCSEALEWLEAYTLQLIAADFPEVQQAQQHLAQCAVCQRRWQVRQQFSRRLAELMPEPSFSELRESSLTTVMWESSSPSVPTPSDAPSGRRARAWSRRRWLLTAASVAGLGLAGWFGYHWPHRTPDLTWLYAAVDVPLEQLPSFRGSFTPRLPRDWQPFFEFDPRLVRGYPAADPHIPRRWHGRWALVSFQFVPRRGREPWRGRLVMLPARDMTGQPTPSESFPLAEINYLPAARGAWMIWQEGDFWYVCLMANPAASETLEHFRRALQTSTTLS